MPNRTPLAVRVTIRNADAQVLLTLTALFNRGGTERQKAEYWHQLDRFLSEETQERPILHRPGKLGLLPLRSGPASTYTLLLLPLDALPEESEA